jgi:hypothetical protein
MPVDGGGNAIDRFLLGEARLYGLGNALAAEGDARHEAQARVHQFVRALLATTANRPLGIGPGEGAGKLKARHGHFFLEAQAEGAEPPEGRHVLAPEGLGVGAVDDGPTSGAALVGEPAPCMRQTGKPVTARALQGVPSLLWA